MNHRQWLQQERDRHTDLEEPEWLDQILIALIFVPESQSLRAQLSVLILLPLSLEGSLEASYFDDDDDNNNNNTNVNR